MRAWPPLHVEAAAQALEVVAVEALQVAAAERAAEIQGDRADGAEPLEDGAQERYARETPVVDAEAGVPLEVLQHVALQGSGEAGLQPSRPKSVSGLPANAETTWLASTPLAPSAMR